MTEVVCSGPGGALLLYGLLHAALGIERVVLIDGKDSFAPKGLPPADLSRLLWTRCHHAGEAIKAADLTIRDGNIPLVVLLLTLNAVVELRKIPATAWHRLQMLAEKSAVTVLVFSPYAQVGCAPAAGIRERGISAGEAASLPVGTAASSPFPSRAPANES